MDYASSKYSFSELGEHINKIHVETKFHQNNIFGKIDNVDSNDKMRPQEETNYIVKLEKMSAEEMMCNRKTNDVKDKKPSGKNACP